ncbi:hypothetical protein VN97_g12066 [Penicillium thymicola]|uniref:Uncharacterized protein n=1 Tax=Penicillium thymicola TaxID=293382 RepID=A0AAI9T6N5_PENTH|nr:hypothetical protein VN97_g12066 [Penicillium thymicola]
MFPFMTKVQLSGREALFSTPCDRNAGGPDILPSLINQLLFLSSFIFNDLKQYLYTPPTQPLTSVCNLRSPPSQASCICQAPWACCTSSFTPLSWYPDSWALNEIHYLNFRSRSYSE